MSKIFDDFVEKIPEEVREFVSISDAIAEKISSLLDKKGMTQKDLANVLGKKESEISKWLTGRHNFTIKSLSNLSTALNEPIIHVIEEPVKVQFHSFGSWHDVSNNIINVTEPGTETATSEEFILRKVS